MEARTEGRMNKKKRWKEARTDRQKNGQVEAQTEGSTDRGKGDRQTEGKTDRQKVGQQLGQTEVRTCRRKYRLKERQTKGRTDRRIDKQK
jgi:hypothetical protein